MGHVFGEEGRAQLSTCDVGLFDHQNNPGASLIKCHYEDCGKSSEEAPPEQLIHPPPISPSGVDGLLEVHGMWVYFIYPEASFSPCLYNPSGRHVLFSDIVLPYCVDRSRHVGVTDPGF